MEPGCRPARTDTQLHRWQTQLALTSPLQDGLRSGSQWVLRSSVVLRNSAPEPWATLSMRNLDWFVAWGKFTFLPPERLFLSQFLPPENYARFESLQSLESFKKHHRHLVKMHALHLPASPFTSLCNNPDTSSDPQMLYIHSAPAAAEQAPSQAASASCPEQKSAVPVVCPPRRQGTPPPASKK